MMRLGDTLSVNGQGATVSVIVPTHNRPALLRSALASIRALENHDLRIEICIGDNGDNPENELIAGEFGCRYGKTSTPGAAAARNAALVLATSDFIGFLDDDDILLEGALSSQIAHMQQDESCRAVLGQVVFADHELRPLAEQWPVTAPPDGDMFKFMLSGYFPQLGATVVRRSVLQEIGLQDEALIGDEDWDWQIRIARDHKVTIIDTPCVLFRGRAPGQNDALQEMRVRFTRRVFVRHAFAAWRRWRSPLEFARSYFLCQAHYYYYFLDAACQHRLNGARPLTRRALYQALSTFPSRFLRSVVCDRGFRQRLFGGART